MSFTGCRAIPVPHDLEQGATGIISRDSHVVPHSKSLHCLDSSRAGHAFPPLALFTIGTRCLPFTPPPHTAEHLDHEVQCDIEQSIGHGKLLHGYSSIVAGHGRAPESRGRTANRASQHEKRARRRQRQKTRHGAPQTTISTARPAGE